MFYSFIQTCKVLSHDGLTGIVNFFRKDRRKARFWQQQGFESRVSNTAIGIQVFIGGDAANPVVLLPQETSKRPPATLNVGEAMVYNADAGTYILMKADGTVEIKTNSQVTVTGDVVADGISLKNHTHLQNNGSHFGGGVQTNPPSTE